MQFWKLICAVLSGLTFIFGGLLCLAILQEDPRLGIASIVPVFVVCFGLSFGFLIGYAVFDIAENVRAMAASSMPEPKAKQAEDKCVTPNNITRLGESQKKAKVKGMLAAGFNVQEVAEILGLDPCYVEDIAQ